MYWELMRYAGAKGCKIFDFGRSKEGTGPYNFKRHWGLEPMALPYWYYAPNGQALPDTVRSILSFNGRSVFGADCRSRLQTLWGRISSGIFLNGIGLSLARVSHGGSLVNLNSLKQVLKLQIDGIDRLAGKANNSED